MYTIHLDKENRLIRADLSGRINRDEVMSYFADLVNIIQPLKQEEYSMILSIEKLDPLPQELLPIMVECMVCILRNLDRIAVVHKKVVTRMQFQRIIILACLYDNIKDKFYNFNSTADAVRFLKNHRRNP